MIAKSYGCHRLPASVMAPPIVEQSGGVQPRAHHGFEQAMVARTTPTTRHALGPRGTSAATTGGCVGRGAPVTPKSYVSRTSGFTLVEALVIIIVIGVLAALIIPQYFSYIGQAKSGVAKGNIANIETAIQTFNLNYNRFPEALDEIVNRPPDIEPQQWNPPVLKQKDLTDPWSQPYEYRYPGEHGVFDLFSYGADGQPAGDGENVDIVNW